MLMRANQLRLLIPRLLGHSLLINLLDLFAAHQAVQPRTRLDQTRVDVFVTQLRRFAVPDRNRALAPLAVGGLPPVDPALRLTATLLGRGVLREWLRLEVRLVVRPAAFVAL